MRLWTGYKCLKVYLVAKCHRFARVADGHCQNSSRQDVEHKQIK